MKKNILIILVFALNISINAQTSNVDELVIRRVADYILEHGKLNFKDVSNGKIYNSTKDIPENAKVTFSNPYVEWHYTNGVLNMALVNLSNFLDDQKYIKYAADQMAFGMDNYKFFQKRYNKEIDGLHYLYPFGQLWTMQELDDFGAMGASMIDIYETVKRDDYKEYIENSAIGLTQG